MSTTDNCSTVHQLYSAFSQGDTGGILSLLSPVVAWRNHGPSVVRTYVPCIGHEQVRDWLGFVAAEFQITEFAPETMIADGDSVVVLGSEKGTVRATGKPYVTRFAHVFTLRDGAIVSYEGFEDSHAIASAFAPE